MQIRLGIAAFSLSCLLTATPAVAQDIRWPVDLDMIAKIRQ